MIHKNAVVSVVRPRTAAVILLAAIAATGCKPDGGSSEPAASGTPAGPASPTKPGSPAAVGTPQPVSPAPTSSAPASAAGVPDSAAIQAAMARTVEVADPSTHFSAGGKPVTTSDRAGGNLTAVVGQRTPTADGKGQLVFFWHGTKFLGWDAVTETDSIRGVTAGPGYFKVAYTHYAAQDPMCCASLPPVTITYAWQDNDGFVPSGQVPHHGDPVRVKLLP